MAELDLSRRPVETGLANLAGLGREDLRQAMVGAGVEEKKARMRVSQLWRWIYHYGVTDFDRATDVAKELRGVLKEKFVLERPPVQAAQTSVDGTRKWLIGYGPNAEAECVYIPDVGKAGALCVSSQVGCTLTCTFCHTGTQKLVRNLTAAEIVNQVMVARDSLGEWPTAEKPLNLGDRLLTNIVFMGMGEPLYNLDNVVEALETIGDGDGISISKRRITVSTAGVAPKLKELGERTGAMLAISLHATNDDLRNELVPINKKYNLKELFDAIRAYPDLSNSKRVTFEYVMLKGVNDTLAEARDLVRLLKGVPSKINLIPFNPWPGTKYECSDWETIEAFAEVLNRAGYASPIRTPRGRDILAACGQLRSESVKEKASERLKARLAEKELASKEAASE
ncbi:MAG TPA: 23S rRNA (adenine(2503)-C(2))-methyltransferase RlmN [Hyphomonadaceae bacterium]|jgi:23S rRNA (adenine2503-C2)-methyltransferase|nr:23S rRNA (adenine(2503)-C(2))-methyltransferase RlmN [Hyphomonadaceae bacterium]